jgi:hypothetical protein
MPFDWAMAVAMSIFQHGRTKDDNEEKVSRAILSAVLIVRSAYGLVALFTQYNFWYLEACRAPTRWYGVWFFYLTFPCCPQNTTRVVFFLPLVVVFYLARIILDDDTSLVKSYYNWYKEYHNPKYHFGGTGSGIFNWKIPPRLRICMVVAVHVK